MIWVLSNSNAVEDCSTTFYPMRRQKINEEAVFVPSDSCAEASEIQSNYLPSSSPFGRFTTSTLVTFRGVRFPYLLNL